MKQSRYYSLFLLTAMTLVSCETVIDASLDNGPVLLSVDATLTDQPGLQTIRLTQTAAYFNNDTPPAAVGATVMVSDNAGQTFRFTDPDNDGLYVWRPGATDTLGRIGRIYRLQIAYQGDTYVAASQMNRVPAVDSLVFRRDRINTLSSKEGYRAEFYARDFSGATDYYRVNYYRNGKRMNKNRDIITLQDASFPGSADTDGLVFIRNFRQSINPDSLYTLNDSVTVEVQSLTAEAFLFWQALSRQISNGGLFATPLANVPTNIINETTRERRAVGFFVSSAVSSQTALVVDRNSR